MSRLPPRRHHRAATGLVDRLGSRARRAAPASRWTGAYHRGGDGVGPREVLAHLLPMFVALDRLDRSFSAEERAVVERYLRGAIEAFGEVEARPPA